MTELENTQYVWSISTNTNVTTQHIYCHTAHIKDIWTVWSFAFDD